MQSFNFTAKDEKLKDVIWSNDIFQIPRYQRPYSWDSTKIEDLWTDLVVNKDTFFLGSLILNVGTDNKRVEIIDGQQRLLTITLLCSALRYVAHEYDKGFSATVHSQCIQGGFLGKDPRIMCGDTLNTFFAKYIQTFPKPDFPSKKDLTKEHRLVIATYNYFKDRIRSLISSKKGKEIETMKELLDSIGDVRIIKIQIYGEDFAYNIFETVNARGTDLSVSDLLKNLVFKNVKEEELSKDGAKQKWLEIEENVEGDMKKFTRYYWLSKHRFVTEKALYRDIKNEITDYEEFLKSLYEASNIYRLILMGEKSEWLDYLDGKKLYRSILGIRALNVTQCYVLLMALIQLQDMLSVSLVKWFEAIENFTFLYSAIGKLPTNKVEKLYSRTATELWEILDERNKAKRDKAIARLFENLKNTFRELIPSTPSFIENFMEIEYRESEQSRIFIKYLLSKLERASGDKELSLDFDDISIEHILPKHPSSDWGLTEDEIKEYVNSLGNLTLISQDMNGKIGNKHVAEKVDALMTSKLNITSELAKNIKENGNAWGKLEIADRLSSLASRSYEVWTIK